MGNIAFSFAFVGLKSFGSYTAGATAVDSIVRPLGTIQSVIATRESTHLGDGVVLREICLLKAIWSIQPTKPCAGVCLEGDTTLRLAATAKLYQSGKIDHVIVSGGVDEPHLDRLPAAVMKESLIKKGLPEDMIILEERSRHTLDHALYVIPLAEQRGFHDLIIITSGYHLLRSYRTFLKQVFNQNYPFSLYGYPAGSAWSWFLKSPTEGRRRFLLLFNELAKIQQRNNDIASIEETWQYVQLLKTKQRR